MKDILASEQSELLRAYSQCTTLLAFDYDGTLAPIVADPQKTSMRAKTREALVQLTRRYNVAVITGRGRKDALRLLGGLPVTEVIGNHGSESADEQPEWFVGKVAEWRALLQARFSHLPEIVIEDKRYSLTVHYRRCADPHAARALVWNVAEQLPGVRLIGGEAVVNVLPDTAPDKGAALLRLQARLHCPRALYVGDDVTDEDVFIHSNVDTLLGVRVGASDGSAAEYFVESQTVVDDLFETILRYV